MKAVGVLLSLLMLAAAFLRWETYVGAQPTYLVPINYFLGIRHYAFDSLVGFGSLPILAALVFGIGIALAGRHVAWNALAIGGSLAAALSGDYTLIRGLMQPIPNYVPGPGLWLFALSATAAFVLSVVLLFRQKPTPAAS